MSKQNTNNAPPVIEDVIKEKLVGEAQKNALDFVAAMQEKEFSFVGWDSGSEVGWTPTYNGKGLGTTLINDQFMFFIGLDWNFDDSRAVEDEIKEFVWAHITVCPQEPCAPPYCQADEHNDNHSKNRWKIFGKEYESTCNAPLQFIGPDAKTLDNIKKLLLMTK